MTSQALSIENLDAGYGDLVVVRDLTLTVDEGSVTALLGANGAGKTTTVMTVSGIIPPISGSVNVLGQPVRSLRRAQEMIRSGLGVVPEHRGLFPALTGDQHLRLATKSSADIRWVISLIPELQIHLRKRAGLLSGGEQQMLAIARALVRRPKLLVVDEMSLGLAPLIASRLGTLLRTLATDEGLAVLIVEQHIELALSIADHVAVLDHGSLAFSGTAAEVAADSSLVESLYLAHAVE